MCYCTWNTTVRYSLIPYALSPQTTNGQRTLKNIKTVLGVYPSDLLPHSIHIQTGTVIINADPHTKEGSHWLAIHFEPKSSKAFYFDSYGQTPSDFNIQAFLRRNLFSGILSRHNYKEPPASCAVNISPSSHYS